MPIVPRIVPPRVNFAVVDMMVMWDCGLEVGV